MSNDDIVLILVQLLYLFISFYGGPKYSVKTSAEFVGEKKDLCGSEKKKKEVGLAFCSIVVDFKRIALVLYVHLNQPHALSLTARLSN